MKTIRRTAALILALLLALFPLVSCSDGGRTALEYEKVRMGERMYGYWLSHYKSVFLRTYEGASDTDEFWDSELSDGMTAEEYLNGVALENIKRYVAGSWLFDYMGLKVSSDMKDEVKKGIDEICSVHFDGDSEKFNEHLASIGIDRDILYNVYIMDVKVETVREYLYGVNGIINVPDSDRMAYLEKNYVRIEHIYVNNKYKLAVDENGEYIADENGMGTRVELTDEEKQAAEDKIEAIRAGISTGGDFDELWEKYSEDKLYPDGYYLLPSTPFIPEVVEAAFTLEVGETRELETEYGTHFIKRLELEGTPWDDEGSEDFFTDFEDDMRAYLFSVMVGETADKVTVHEDIVGEYTIRDVPESPYV